MTRALGRRPPTDWQHVARYPLRAAPVPTVATPGIVGSNWYRAMDEPIWDERGHFWYIAPNARNLGQLRGGHAYCIGYDGVRDSHAWWHWHNQGFTSQCVGWSIARAMAMLNRQRYDAVHIYTEAQRIDEWTGEDYDGTSVRAGLDVARTIGLYHIRAGQRTTLEPQLSLGIAANRWAATVEEFVMGMSSPRFLALGRVPIYQSWGDDGHREGTNWEGAGWPHVVWLPIDTLDRLRAEDGELAIITDR